MPITTIDLLRHGEPVGGSRYRGQIDDPLSERGWEEMWHAVSGNRPWQAIISSPLQRCSQFAQALSSKLNISLERECRYLVIHFRISLSKNDSFTRQLFPFAPAVLRSPRLRIPHRSKLLVPHAIMAPTMTLRR
ncbi:MAG: histidine phosphatase family protein [Candidatus Thiodiazotropha sp. (ex. Lucinoma kazani)]